MVPVRHSNDCRVDYLVPLFALAGFQLCKGSFSYKAVKGSEFSLTELELHCREGQRGCWI